MIQLVVYMARESFDRIPRSLAEELNSQFRGKDLVMVLWLESQTARGVIWLFKGQGP